MPNLLLVHDYLLVLRGAERTFAAMSDMWPEAPIATLLYDEAATHGRFAGHRVLTSPLQRLGLRQRHFRGTLPVLPNAVRRLPVDGASCIVSSSSAFAHGIRKPSGARHVCYCHSPFRYAWHDRAFAARWHSALGAAGPQPLAAAPSRLRPEGGPARRPVRGQRAGHPDRIRRFWGRDAPVVHPPVDVERFAVSEPEDYVLFVGELVAHKRADLAIEAATAAGVPIKVAGAGPELRRLKARYRGQAEFLGRVADEELPGLYAEAAALLVPSVEEFGMAAVEAQAAGRPVIAVNAGGARETVIPGRTGWLVPNGDAAGMARALRTDLTQFDSEDIRAHAQTFSRSVFESRLREIVEAG